MGFRFRRSMKIVPGVRLNVTKNGVNSVSLGGPGASLNMGRGGTRTTVGLPGSGVSYSSRTGSESSLGAGLAVAGLFVLIIAAIRGNRLARISLTALGLGFLFLWANNGSPGRNGSSARSDAFSGTTSTNEQWSVKPAPGRNLAPTALIASTFLQPSEKVSEPAETPPTTPVEPKLSEEAVITTTGANVRAAPSMKGKILRQLDVGTPLFSSRSVGNWAYVRISD